MSVGYFPCPPCPHSRSNTREPFASYGTTRNVLYSGDTLHPQYTRKCPISWTASIPTLPLIPPNQVSDVFNEPCISHLTETANNVKHKLQNLVVFKGRMNGEYKSLRNGVQKFLNEMDILENKYGGDMKTDDLKEDDKISFNFAIAQTPPWFQSLAEKNGDIIGKDVYVPKSNLLYSGGNISSCCLSSENTSENGQIIAYASHSKLDHISLSLLEDTSTIPIPDLSRSIDVNLEDNGPVYQVDLANVHNNIFLITRQKSHTDLIRLNTDDWNAKVVDNVSWDEENGCPSHVCLNSHIPEEYFVATSKGSIFHSQMNSISQVIDCVDPKFTTPETEWVSVDIGSHPRQVTVTDRTAIDLYDIRTKSQPSPIFSLPNSVLHTNERIMVSTTHLRNPYHHLVATDYSLLLLDQRFANHPVLMWSHDLLSPPSYLKHAWFQDEDVDTVLLACQNKPEVHTFHLRLTDGQKPTQALGLPWRASRPRDFAKFAQSQGLELEPTVLHRKLDLPLMGISALQQSDSLSICQLTSHGDLFFQKFSKNKSSLDKTWNCGPGSINLKMSEDAMKYAKDWLLEAKEIFQQASVNICDPKSLDASASFLTLNKQAYSHVMCSLCYGAKIDVDVGEIDDEDVCLGCGHKLGFSKDMVKAKFGGANSIQNTVTNVALPFSKTLDFQDVNSRIYSKLWRGDNDIMADIEERSKGVEERKAEAMKNKKVEKTDLNKEEMELDAADEATSEEPVMPSRSVNDEQSKSCADTSNEGSSDSNNAQFLTEDDIRQSLTQKGRSMSSKASVSSLGSNQSPGFSSIPLKLRQKFYANNSSRLQQPASSRSPISKGVESFIFKSPSPFKMSKKMSFSPSNSPSQLQPKGHVKKKRKFSNVMGF